MKLISGGGKMVEADNSQLKEVVAHFQNEASAFKRQWATWLGVGSGGGIIALLSFSAALPDPDRALSLLLPAISAFVVAVVFAAPSVLLLAAELESLGDHFASAHNRESIKGALSKMTMVTVVPRSLENRCNAEREHYLQQADRENKNAEDAWRARSRWRWLRRLCMGLSAFSFIYGATYPLMLIANDIPFVLKNEDVGGPEGRVSVGAGNAAR